VWILIEEVLKILPGNDESEAGLDYGWKQRKQHHSKRMNLDGPSFCVVAFDVGDGRRRQMRHHYYKKWNQLLGLVSN
jgi:hypothetical protein